MKLNLSALFVTLVMAHAAEQPQNLRRELQTSDTIDFNGQGCYDFDPYDSSWVTLPRNDDGEYLVTMEISFPWLGGTKNNVYISNNGHLSFSLSNTGFNAGNFFTTDYDIIAPYWADVNTNDPVDGFVRWKSIPGDKFIVMWEEVARYGGDSVDPLVNTFQAVLSADGSICFCYGGMEWVRGSLTSTTTEPVVGIVGAATDTFLIGSFDDTSTTFNYMSTGNGIGYLPDKSFCFAGSDAITNPPTLPEILGLPEVGPGGDPHITTWIGEHFEYHGQCDLTLAKDANFADGQGLDIQIRTKIVRYWSYIKNVAIKIGNDILEIEGSADVDDAEAHYWVNFEYQGELETFAGFPVTQKLPSVYKRQYIIDLSSKYPGQEIVVELYKEFVRVRFHGDHRAFGNTVGLMGDFHTGKTLARDGKTVMDDFTEFGDEWQVLPSEPKLFREVAQPQFPELCIKPEDPRGERKRRLAESTISIEQAEAACAKLNDPLSIKDCVYDILATQDMDMVGAF